jgi:hypothetical protein
MLDVASVLHYVLPIGIVIKAREIMNRRLQGVLLVLCLIGATILVLAGALAWGPHQCKLAFPMIIGCAMGSYEGLASGMFAASAALFAGWLAWSAVQKQITAEERRAAADKIEIEKVLQEDLDYLAEGLRAIWMISAELDRAENMNAETRNQRIDGLIYGIERVTKYNSTIRSMIASLGWERRREYERLLEGLEHLATFQDLSKFDPHEVHYAAMDVSDYFRILRPETEENFKGLWQRSHKAWTLGYAIAVNAGFEEQYYKEPVQ